MKQVFSCLSSNNKKHQIASGNGSSTELSSASATKQATSIFMLNESHTSTHTEILVKSQPAFLSINTKALFKKMQFQLAAFNMNALMLLLFALFTTTFAFAQPSDGGSRVESISSAYVSTPEGSTYTAFPAANSGSFAGASATTNIDYAYGSSSGVTNNSLRVTNFVVGTGGSAKTYEYLAVGTQEVRFKRVNNAVCSVARELVWMEGVYNGLVTPRVLNINRPYEERMDILFNGTSGFNSGTDNLFNNSGDGNGNNNNIERMDVIFPKGVKVNTPANAGFALFERGATSGHDGFVIALITGLDANGDPSSYATTYHRKATGWGNADVVSNKVYQVLRKDPSDANLRISAPSINQPIGGIFFSFSDFGISANTVVYGYSLASIDFTPTGGSITSSRMVDFTNTTYFPTNTTATSGGIDLIGVTGVTQVTNSNAAQPQEEYKTISPIDANGKPTVTAPEQTVTTEFENKITTSLPEGESVVSTRPTLLNCTTNDITVSATTEVTVTFVRETTSKTNALAFYRYNTASPYTSAPPKDSLTIIFANASGSGSSGGLTKGTTVSLGTFYAGQSIGWALVDSGYYSNLNAVGDGANVYYSNPAFNPGSGNTRKYMIQFYDTASQRTVMAWEDANRTASSDNDFNDNVFYFTSSTQDACTTCQAAGLRMSYTEASESQQGGLESMSLGDAISQYRFSLIRNNGKYLPQQDLLDPTAYQNFQNVNSRADAIPGENELTSFLPLKPEGNFIRSISNPIHLIGLTNAQAVGGANYRRGAVNGAATLLLKTYNRPYNHTKTICDRVGNATIKDVIPVKVSGFEFGRNLFQRKDGSFEYATSFSIAVNRGSNTARIQADWRAVQAASADTLYNYQVWASEGNVASDLIGKVLEIFRKKGYNLYQNQVEPTVPKYFVNNASRKDNILTLNLTNNSGATQYAGIDILQRDNETARNRGLGKSFTLAKGLSNINFDLADGMDQDIRLYVAPNTVDNLYASDTRWVLDYDRNTTIVNNFITTNNFNRSYSTAEHNLLRGFKLSATFLRKSEINVYKLASVDGAIENFNRYKAIRFKVKGNAKMMVKITKKGIENWLYHYTKTFTATNDEQVMTINFSEFTSPITNAPLTLEDVSSIVFVAVSDDYEKKAINVKVDDIALVQRNVITPPVIIAAPVVAQPNPFNGRFNAEFTATSAEPVVIVITDMNGTVIHQQSANTIRGFNRIPVAVTQHLSSKMYKLNIKASNQKFATTTLISGGQ